MSNKTNADRHTQLTEVAITTSKFKVVKNLFVRLFFSTHHWDIGGVSPIY